MSTRSKKYNHSKAHQNVKHWGALPVYPHKRKQALMGQTEDANQTKNQSRPYAQRNAAYLCRRFGYVLVCVDSIICGAPDEYSHFSTIDSFQLFQSKNVQKQLVPYKYLSLYPNCQGRNVSKKKKQQTPISRWISFCCFKDKITASWTKMLSVWGAWGWRTAPAGAHPPESCRRR